MATFPVPLFLCNFWSLNWQEFILSTTTYTGSTGGSVKTITARLEQSFLTLLVFSVPAKKLQTCYQLGHEIVVLRVYLFIVIHQAGIWLITSSSISLNNCSWGVFLFFFVNSWLCKICVRVCGNWSVEDVFLFMWRFFFPVTEKGFVLFFAFSFWSKGPLYFLKDKKKILWASLKCVCVNSLLLQLTQWMTHTANWMGTKLFNSLQLTV